MFSTKASVSRATPSDKIPPVAKPADESERKIITLYALMYDREHGLFCGIYECINLGGGKYKFDTERVGDFTIYLVANPDDALLGTLKLGPPTDEDLLGTVTSKMPGDEGFVMTTTTPIKASTVAGEITNVGVIKLTRLAARFDIENKVPDLSLTKVTFNNRCITSRLGASLSVSDDIVKNSAMTYDASNGLTNSGATALIYGYENGTKGETSFIIEGAYRGKPIKPYNIVLENTSVKRNHNYKIVIEEPLNKSETLNEENITIETLSMK